MTSRCKVLAAVLATLAGASQAQVPIAPRAVTPPQLTSVTVVASPTASSAEMQYLVATAQELRQAIGLLAGKPPGPERDMALAQARKALLKTQQAMIDLPPELRGITTARAPHPGYDPSVQALMAAADSLRDSIHVMARDPASERRNQAIRDANRALLDMQASMANAYDATAFAPRTTTLGAGPMQCAWLGTMWGCT